MSVRVTTGGGGSYEAEVGGGWLGVEGPLGGAVRCYAVPRKVKYKVYMYWFTRGVHIVQLFTLVLVTATGQGSRANHRTCSTVNHCP